MNIRTTYIFRTFAALMLCAFAGSCTQDELGEGRDEALPVGKYPLMFTASVDRMTSRTDDGKELWGDGDVIDAQFFEIDDDGKRTDYPVIGHYMLNEDGTVKKCEEPLSWPYKEGYVKAWYPSGDLPCTKALDNQANGFHNIDFLYAESGKEQYNNTVDLKFQHKMTKVRVKLIKGKEGITDEDLATAKVRFYGDKNAEFSINGVTGDGNFIWLESTSENDILLVPQDMSGKPFIKVDIAIKMNGVPIDKTLIYTPGAGKGILEAGSAYNYNITVERDRLVVESISGQWIDDQGPEYADEIPRLVYFPKDHKQTLTFSSNVTLVSGNSRAGDDRDYLLVKGKEFSISYELSGDNHMKGFFPPVEDANNLTMNCVKIGNRYTYTYKLDVDTASLVYDDYVQVGDIYYSDGTWSHGKLDNKTPIGVVFRTGAANTDPSNNPGNIDIPTNYGWDRERLIRGYVVALKDASTIQGCWANDQSGNKAHQRYLTTTYAKASLNTDETIYSGYYNTNKVREENAENMFGIANESQTRTGLWAFKVAVDFRPDGIPEGDPTAPIGNKGSSGWYLPSIRQLIDLNNLFGLSMYFKEAGGVGFDIADNNYWSSTECKNQSNACTTAFRINFVKMTQPVGTKNQAIGYVRAVLTF